MRAAVVTGASLPRGSDASSAAFDAARTTLRLKPARLQRMDRLCALALVAADGALADAGLSIEALRAMGGERIGVVVGTRFGCHATNEEYFRGLLADGPRGASPRLFAYTLPSSPLGELSIHFGARGPAQTVASGRQAGVEALARAASLCAQGRADLVLALAVEVGGGTFVGAGCLDGAVALVVEARETADAARRIARARIAGGGLAFSPPPELAPAKHLGSGSSRAHVEQAQAQAGARALVEAGLPPRPLSSLPMGAGEGSVDALAGLVDWLRGGPGEGAAGLLVDGDESGGAAAVVVVATAAAGGIGGR